MRIAVLLVFAINKIVFASRICMALKEEVAAVTVRYKPVDPPQGTGGVTVFPEYQRRSFVVE